MGCSSLLYQGMRMDHRGLLGYVSSVLLGFRWDRYGYGDENGDGEWEEGLKV